MNAVIYARYSSDRQREESIEGQLRECTDYAMKNNLTLLGTYVDRALSARTADRPDFQRMILDLRSSFLLENDYAMKNRGPPKRSTIAGYNAIIF